VKPPPPEADFAGPAGPRRLLFDVFRRQRRRVLLGAACWTSYQTCEVLVPVAIGIAVDAAVTTSDTWALVWSVVMIFAVFITLTASWRTGADLLARGSLEEAHRLRSLALRRILGGAGIRTERSSGELLSITTSDANATSEVLELGSQITSAVIGLVLTAVLLLNIDWVLGVGILVLVPLLTLALNALGPYVQRRTADQQQAVGAAAGTAADLLEGLRPLRGFGGVPEAARRYRDASRRSLAAGVGALRAETTFLGVTTLTSGLLLAAVAAVAGAFALQQRISIGELVTVVGLAAFLADPVRNLAAAVFEAAIARASAGRLAEVLSAPLRNAAGTEPVGAGPLELDGVRGPGLSGLDLIPAPGELVGVVAPELAAADGLARMLAGRQPPADGEIRLAGRPLSVLDPGAVCARLLVEPHHVDLFGGSLGEAIRTGDEPGQRDPDRVRAALTAASVGDFGADPDRSLTDHGQNLSGGQRQRLALARALLADRPVLVLHDPTTAVDAVTENAIADGLRTMRATTTRSTVVITTSPPLLARCDRVLFCAPDVVHEGTHTELLGLTDYAAAVAR
jgi:putative ABC transport system ATP-binding protein